ncbi:MAG: TonB-dependent receptor domain-containing protein [Hyphomicrobium sp.]
MSVALRAALLGATALAALPCAAAAQDSPKSADLPAVTVTTPSAAPNASSKPKKPKPTSTESYEPAPPSEPSGTEAAGAAEAESSGAQGAVAPGTRSGSLTAPTTAEARADIETTPGGVDLVPSEQYAKSTPAVTLKDALDYVPGVFVQPKWAEDSRLSIRGSGLSRNFHGRGVYLLMDGVIPITTADGSSDFQEIDPTAYRYIEVYKGANALKYGANSLGGAINFVMPTGYDSDLFGARVDVGSFGFHKLTASSGGVYGAADYFITGTWQEQDGFRDHSEGSSERGSMNVGYRLSEDAETRFYLNANQIRQKIPGAVTREEALNNPKGAFVRPGEPSGFLGVGNDNVDRDYERNVDSIRVANKTTVRLAPGTLVDFGGFYFDRHLDHPILLVIDNQNREVGGFARMTDERLIGGYRNRLIAGVTAHHGDVHARTYRTILGERGALLSDADQISTTTTAYLEDAFYLTRDFALVGGAQYTTIDRKLDDNFLSNGDESRSADFDFWSPKFGFLWDASRHAQVFGNISKSYEAATFNEITFVSGNTLALRPQEAVTYEIGMRGAGPGFSYDLALYRANLENEFQCLSTGASGTCTQINLDSSIHQGVEIGGAARLWRHAFDLNDALWLNAAYTFSDFRFDDDATFGDNELPGAPRHFVRAELLYRHPTGVYFGPNVEWVPQAYYVDSANTLETKAYALLGAKLGFDGGGPVSAYIEGRNLTDEAYISSASIATRANAASTLFEPGAGRAVFAGVQVRW